MKITNTIRAVFEKYLDGIRVLFLLFLLGVLSFGRAFSVLHINTSLTPIFITEIFLFIALPFIVTNPEPILKLPNMFLVPFLAYFLLGGFHLFLGILNSNLFAVRDIVLCGYILFLPLTVIIFSQKNKLKIFLFVLMLSNIIVLIIGKFHIVGFEFMPTKLANLLRPIKNFHMALYYGIATSFLISGLSIIKNRTKKKDFRNKSDKMEVNRMRAKGVSIAKDVAPVGVIFK